MLEALIAAVTPFRPGWIELPEAYGAVLWGLAKGASHKYIKRVPKAGGGYRYYYHVAHGGGVHHADHFVEGASFRHGDGHYHITHASGDSVTIKHDESGHTQTFSKTDLRQKLLEHHAAALQSHHAKATARLAEAKANKASPKQIAKLERQAVIGAPDKPKRRTYAEIVASSPIPTTKEEAVKLKTELAVAKWGEAERESARVAANSESFGMLMNGIVHDKELDFGANAPAGWKEAARKALSGRDRVQMRDAAYDGDPYPTTQRPRKRVTTSDRRQAPSASPTAAQAPASVLPAQSVAPTQAPPKKAPSETHEDRIKRLGLTDIPSRRMDMLSEAHAAGVSDKTFSAISDALRAEPRGAVVIPVHDYESTGRGRGWARQGEGAKAKWGKRVSGGYEVGPGTWIVGGDDGFKRKGQHTWKVEHVQVGPSTWTIAK